MLLIAANVGAMRDHKQSDRIEQLTKQNEEMAERLLSVEQLLEHHITKNLTARATEIPELGTLVREVHAVVCATDGGVNGNTSGTADSASPAPAKAQRARAHPPARPDDKGGPPKGP